MQLKAKLFERKMKSGRTRLEVRAFVRDPDTRVWRLALTHHITDKTNHPGPLYPDLPRHVQNSLYFMLSELDPAGQLGTLRYTEIYGEVENEA